MQRRHLAAGVLLVVVLIGCDASENFAKDGPRLKTMVAMLQDGRIKPDPDWTGVGTRAVVLPAELKDLCTFGVVRVRLDEKTHALAQASCQQSGGCMGDCSTQYVYVASDALEGKEDDGISVRRIEKNWFWMEEHR